MVASVAIRGASRADQQNGQNHEDPLRAHNHSDAKRGNKCHKIRRSIEPRRGQALKFLTNPSRRYAVPQYEYFCHSCQKAFSRILTLLEYDKGKITCPNCGSKDVEQAVTAFFAVGSKKS